MGRKTALEDLREENNGYNPEPLDSHDEYKIVESRRDHLVLLNRETGEREHWVKSTCKTEMEYIERWPRRFALIHKDSFYYLAA